MHLASRKRTAPAAAWPVGVIPDTRRSLKYWCELVRREIEHGFFLVHAGEPDKMVENFSLARPR